MIEVVFESDKRVNCRVESEVAAAVAGQVEVWKRRYCRFEP